MERPLFQVKSTTSARVATKAPSVSPSISAYAPLTSAFAEPCREWKESHALPLPVEERSDLTEGQDSTARGLKGCIITTQDGFTCDLIHLAEFCIAAKPFDFDIKIMTSEINLNITESAHTTKPLS